MQSLPFYQFIVQIDTGIAVFLSLAVLQGLPYMFELYHAICHELMIKSV